MSHELLAECAAVTGDDVEDAFGQTRLGESARELEPEGRGSAGGLADHRIPANESRGKFPGGNCDRKIPGRDERDHAERIATGEEEIAGKVMRNGLSAQGVTHAAVEAEDIDGALHLARGLCKGLALFARQ